MSTPRITKNAAQCRKCGDVVESKHRHDYVRCRCGAIAVDGGHEYLKRTGNPNDMAELNEWEESAASHAKEENRMSTPQKEKPLYVCGARGCKAEATHSVESRSLILLSCEACLEKTVTIAGPSPLIEPLLRRSNGRTES